jgi:hypothetical protein
VRRDEQVFASVGPGADLQLADLRVVRPAPHVGLAENVRFKSGRASHLALLRHDAVCLFPEQRHLRQVGAAQKCINNLFCETNLPYVLEMAVFDQFIPTLLTKRVLEK